MANQNPASSLSQTLYNQTLKMARGQTYSIPFIILLNNTPVDITGGSFRFTAKYDFYDDDSAAVFQKFTSGGGIVITSAANGAGTITVVPSDTSTLPTGHNVQLFYDLEYVDSNGNISYPVSGMLVVYPRVTSTQP